MSGKVFVALLVLCSLPLSINSQQTQPPSPSVSPAAQKPPRDDEAEVVRITTNLVQVDAVVTKDNKQVTDLKPEDFELFEDGKPQAITNFSYISNVLSAAPSTANRSAVDRSGLPVVPPAVHPRDVRRTIVFVVDDLGMSFDSIVHARGQIRKYLDELAPGDLAAIIRTGGDAGTLQQFTNNRQLLQSAADHLRWNPCSRSGLYVFKPAGSTGENVSICAQTLGGGTLRSLRFILRGMSYLPGRKSMVLLSDNLPIQDQEPSRFEQAMTAHANDSDNGGQSNSGDPNFGSGISYYGQLQRIAEIAIRSSVVIYGVDTRGLQYTGLTAADKITATNGAAAIQQINSLMASRSAAMINGREGTDLIARQTGGFLIRNSNDFGLRRVMEDQQGYYLIGFRPNEETFNKSFHSLRLKLKRKGLTVRTRNGFYGITEDQARPPELESGDQMRLALISPFGSSEIEVRLGSFFANDAVKGSLVRSSLYLKAGDLTFADQPDGTHEASFDLSSVVFGDNGRVISRQDQVATLKLHAKSYERAQREGIVYNFDMPVKSTGVFQFRVAVRDRTSARIGAAGQFVELPDLRRDRLALSGIVIHGESQPPQGSTNEPADSADSNISSGPAVRQFRQGSNLIAAYAVYNALLDTTTGQPRLTTQMRIFHDSKLVFTGDPKPFDAKGQTDLQRLVTGTGLYLGPQLPPGDYVLQIIVEDLLGKEKARAASQWIDFEIVK